MKNAIYWDEIFFNAALDSDEWPNALEQMAKETGASHGQLIGLGSDRTIPFNFVTNFDDEVRRALELEATSPEKSYRVAASEEHIAQGKFDPILHEAHYDAVMPQLLSRHYVDFCNEIDIPYGCQTNLVFDNRGLIGLATLRSRKDGRTSPAERQVFAQAVEAARRAVRLQERLESDQARLLAGAFEAMAATAFVLDGRGRVRALTSKAESLARNGQVRISGGVLSGPGTPMSLQQCVAALTVSDGLAHVQVRVGDEEIGGPKLFLEGFRLPRRDWQFGWPPQAILISRTPSRDRAGISGFLNALYGFSGAEADIAMRLFDDQDRAAIAATRQVTPDTLRGQIKALLSKAACPNEASLMRLLRAIMS